MAQIRFQQVIMPEGSRIEKHEVFLEGEYVGSVQCFKGKQIWIPSNDLRAFFGPNPIVGAKSLEDIEFLLLEIWEG